MRSEQWELLYEDLEPIAPGCNIWSAVIAASAYGENSRRYHWWYTHVERPALAANQAVPGHEAVDVAEGISGGVEEKSSSTRNRPGKRQRDRVAVARAPESAKPKRVSIDTNTQPGIVSSSEKCFNWNKGMCKPDRCHSGREHLCWVCGKGHRAVENPDCKAKLPDRPSGSVKP